MKKLNQLFAALVALSCSSLVFAQANNEIGSLTSSGTISTTDCTVLGTGTPIKISSNSLITYKCSPFYNQIVMMTCNTAGSRTPSTIACKFLADANGSVQWPADSSPAIMGEWNDDKCSAEVDADNNAIMVDIVGGKYFSQSSAGGSLAASGGGATDTCDTTVMEGKI